MLVQKLILPVPVHQGSSRRWGRTLALLAMALCFDVSLVPAVDFPVGNRPLGIAFDGANIWVANANDFSLTRLRASDGANLGTVIPPAEFPYAIAFDGANVWVTGNFSDNVAKLRASDGAPLGATTVGVSPRGVAFDGTNIWVANHVDNTVTKVRASDAAVLGTFAVGRNPEGVAFDGANVWVTNYGGGTVTKLRASDGMTLRTLVVGSGPWGVAFDGANVWVGHSFGVTKLRASDGANLGTFAPEFGFHGVAFDGANIWATIPASPNGKVVTLRASDGARLATFAVGSGPEGIAFDEANIWVTSANSKTVSKLENVIGTGFFTLTPCRLVDTRDVGAPMGGPALQGQEARVFAVTGQCGVPPGTRAVALNLTVMQPSAMGNVLLLQAGQSLPTASTVNYAAGQTRASNAVVPLNASGELSAFVAQPIGTSVHAVIDVTGYFQ